MSASTYRDIGKSIVIALALASALGACTTDDTWTQAQARHATKVTLSRELHTVAYTGGGLQPGQPELERITALARADSNSQPVQILYVPERGASLAPRRASELQRVLQARGIAAAPPTVLDPGMAAPGSVMIAATHYVATPPNCPDWSKRSESNHDNLPPSNFGCATERNLGLMVADPADLVRGRDYSGQDGSAAVNGIQRYRAGKIPPLPSSDTTTGAGQSAK